FNKLGINTLEVLKAAETKWNFLPFRPGLVGGHCIGVDPYYLTHKAQEVGYHPDMILAGRRINDNMGRHIASSVIKLMTRKGIDTSKARILVLGLTFKENCPDLRNTKVIDIISEIEDFGIDVEVYDPWVKSEDALKIYGITLLTDLMPNRYDGIIIAVAHHQFASMDTADFRSLCRQKSVLFDVKNILPASEVDGTL
ncbi:MAG: Vi polysaccharide biosynthesis UDP-N-acetylglucosamine C-6 dehydrogenase TviB, partial [Desulfobulbaceae bacterium]